MSASHLVPPLPRTVAFPTAVPCSEQMAAHIKTTALQHPHQHHNGTVWFCKHGFINPFVSLYYINNF